MSKQSSKPLKKSAILSIGIKVLLTLAAFWLAFRDVQWENLEGVLSQQTSAYFALAAGCVFFQIILGGLRWRYIMAALSDDGKEVITFSEAFRIYYISVFFSNCLPGTIGGDVVRGWMVRSDRVSLSLSVNSIIIDRLLALAGVFLVILFLIPVLAEILGLDLWSYVLAFVVLMAGGLWLAVKADHALKPFEHIRIILWARHFFNCLRLLIRNPVMSFYSLLFASLSHVFYGFAAYFLAVGMGAETPLIYFIALMPLVMLAITLPISIAGWGVREMVMVYLFTLVGLAGTISVAVSLQLGLLNIFVSLPAALLWLVFKRRQAVEQTS